MASFPFQFTSAAFWWISVFLTQMSDSRLPVWWRLAETYQRLTELGSQQTWLKKDSIQQPGQGKGAGPWSWWTLPPKQERWSRPRTKPDKQASITPSSSAPPSLGSRLWVVFTDTHSPMCTPNTGVWTEGRRPLYPFLLWSYSAKHILASTSQKTFKNTADLHCLKSWKANVACSPRLLK